MSNDTEVVIKPDRVIDGISEKPIEDGLVVIDGSKITAVGKKGEVNIPSDVDVIETSGTIIPGLIDTHVHLNAFSVSSFKNHRVALYETLPELQHLYGLHHARMMLDNGFTTVRDMPYPTNTTDDTSRMEVANRDAIENGIFRGPRLVVGGYAHITNSHFDVLVPRGAPRDPKIHKTGWTADGPYELRKQVREKLLRGCNFIKTVASGGGGTPLEPPDVRNMTQEELNAVVDESHAFHKHCSCHCFTPESQLMAVKAGVDTIEHCVFTDEDALDAMEESNTPVVPTLMHRTDRAIQIREEIGSPESMMHKMKKLQEYCWDTFERLCERDIPIAMGTDIHFEPEMGSNIGELEIYVDLGMNEMDALKTATKNAAEAIQIGNETGTLEPGKYADLILVDGNPLSDITILQNRKNLKIVMKEGQIQVDRRPEKEQYLFANDKYRWNRIKGGGESPIQNKSLELDLPEEKSQTEVELDVPYHMSNK